jgi:hypothetical protein
MRGANQRDDDILIDGKDIALLSGSSDSPDHPNFAPAFLTCWPSFNHPNNVVLNAEQAEAIHRYHAMRLDYYNGKPLAQSSSVPTLLSLVRYCAIPAHVWKQWLDRYLR